MWKVNNTDIEIPAGPPGQVLPRAAYPPDDSPMGQTTVLYDLEADIGETNNIADQHPEIVERLESELGLGG